MTGNFDINKELLDAMRIIARQEIEKCNRDITKTARVINVNNDKTVKIEMDGKQYDNIPNYNGTTLSVNNIVKVTYPQGQASNMYVSGGGEDEIYSKLVSLENSTVVMDYATAINITTLKTWTESSYAISSPPAGFTFGDIVSITAFAQDGYGDRWLRVMANQRANASGILSLMGYCINTTGSIPIIIRVIFKK